MERVIVLQPDMSILRTTNYKRAICLVVSGKAEVLVNTDIRIHPKMFVPAVIRLVKSIRNLWKTEVPWSKQSVHIRDNYICQYCGTKIVKSKATVDHIIPKSQGGKNTWENTVCSCYSCNNAKGDRTPEQAKMTLLKKPSKPTIMEFLMRKVKSEGLENVLKELQIY